ncbi:hypothetical protein [Sulfobacillus harzensis]|uniref:Uncharacterized protein n=1 Tax=Sulfobacillus harzensis TaxID=2729629 RepID=A0A7Y0L2P2_9FIRM|nr:hypothetical protein [Sulfobacillus harzensis]NMP22193.1 hypothetical protein [Sulfobacillus harzensis]
MTDSSCLPCWHLLKAACTYGQDVRLCEAFLEYDQTGSPTVLDTVMSMASPTVLKQARAHVVALGLAHES